MNLFRGINWIVSWFLTLAYVFVVFPILGLVWLLSRRWFRVLRWTQSPIIKKLYPLSTSVYRHDSWREVWRGVGEEWRSEILTLKQ